MKNGYKFCIVAAALIFLLSMIVSTSSADSEHIAARTERILEKRLRILDREMKEAMESDHSEWLDLKNLPEDMVVYRYVYDTLQSWNNQFPILNDDLGSRLIFQRFSSIRTSMVSPLSEIGDRFSYVNLGPKWYIARIMTDGVDCRIVGGLEIKNSLLEGLRDMGNGVNPRLKIGSWIDICPLNESGGTPVSIDGQPMFKLLADTTVPQSLFANSILRWLGLLMVTFAILFWFWTHRSIRNFAIAAILMTGMTASVYFLGKQVNYEIFSPTVYAGGKILYSFGAMIILNLGICMYILCVFLARRQFIGIIRRKNTNAARLIYSAAITGMLILTCVYVHFSIKSLAANSNISLELYLWNQITIYTVIVYISYTAIFFSILLLVQMLKPVSKYYFNIKYNAFSVPFLFIFAILCAGYLSAVSAVTGYRKEKDRIMVWTNRLAVDRDLEIEIQLRSVENEIAGDPFLSTLSGETMSSMMILNRLTENYLGGISRNYDVIVTLCPNTGMVTSPTGEKMNCLEYFNRRVRTGSPLADNSRFFYVNENGIPGYIGMFIYYSEKSGITRMFLEVKPKAYSENRGLRDIPGLGGRAGTVSIPPLYSYAKYISGKLVTYRGNYAYPAVISDKGGDMPDPQRSKIFKTKNSKHFVSWISDNEVIVISRPVRGIMIYFITFSYMVLIIFGFLYVFSKKKKKRGHVFRKNYYRTRINTLLCTALFLTLIIMTTASVTFVYNRNENNMNNLMSSKINTVKAMLESRIKYLDDYHALNSREFSDLISEAENIAKSDINLYTPGGKIFKSTTPEIFDRSIFGSRINQDAYYNIVYENRRIYINREEFAGHTFYSMYAPLFNGNGNLLAILNSPYTDQGYDLKRDAFFHSATIINLFIILLAATIIVSTTIVNGMFRPILEMGRKMNSTGIHGLEYIIYKREDEISTLVEAYNRMVHDLSDSTRKLAQAERDKAWSEMARQVAHEIKNPLTPIKLEIQRLIRLKQKNDPSWEEKFDKVSAVILEHIDILTETANEFSTFAKLYSETPVELDLDRIIQEQLTIFDNKENITMSYMGLDNAMVMAPKPQLIRVFVNLMTNAIQAIEIQQKEDSDAGREPVKGQIAIFIRNSMKDGYYDIVFEDNGPGVREENLGKLFTPNFTTKSSGTGLGLAICRNIVEKCNGEILYQRSFVLKGACFTVRLPKLR